MASQKMGLHSWRQAGLRTCAGVQKEVMGKVFRGQHMFVEQRPSLRSTVHKHDGQVALVLQTLEHSLKEECAALKAGVGTV